MVVDDVLVDHCAIIFLCEINKGLVKDEQDVSFLAPCSQPKDIRLLDVVSTRIIRVDKNQCRQFLIRKISHQIIRCIGEILIVRRIDDAVLLRVTVWILLKRRSNKPYFASDLFHQAFNKLRCAVADEDVFLMNSEILGS